MAGCESVTGTMSPLQFQELPSFHPWKTGAAAITDSHLCADAETWLPEPSRLYVLHGMHQLPSTRATIPRASASAIAAATPAPACLTADKLGHKRSQEQALIEAPHLTLPHQQLLPPCPGTPRWPFYPSRSQGTRCPPWRMDSVCILSDCPHQRISPSPSTSHSDHDVPALRGVSCAGGTSLPKIGLRLAKLIAHSQRCLATGDQWIMHMYSYPDFSHPLRSFHPAFN